jgi:hypothetical protein
MLEAPGQRTVDAGTSPREIFVNDSGKSILPGPNYLDGTNSTDGRNTGRTDEIRAGTIVAQVTATKKWVPCKRSKANGVGRASQALSVDDARAFRVGDQVAVKSAIRLGKVEDIDSASSTGVALYLHVDELGESPVGHLEAVNAGNADSSFTLLNGAVVKVEDDDAAATGGTQIYFDEDAANPDERFLSAVATGKDAFILASDGTPIRIKYSASPSSAGVAVYFDDDGATTSERLLFVSPTNVDGFYNSDDVYPRPADEVTRTSGNAITAIDYSTQTLTLTTAATWADDDQVYCDSLAGSEIGRGILAEGVRLLSGEPYESTQLDKQAVIADAGFVDSAQLLGDYAAIRASSDSYLSGFRWLDRQRA